MSKCHFTRLMNALCQVTADEEEYARLTSLMKGELGWRSGMRDAKREGYKEGLNEGFIEGRNEANLENARKMKADNMPVSQICKYTGLSQEIIAQL